MAASEPGPTVVLVGTAHVIDLAEPIDRVFRRYHPDAVGVELDRARADALLSGAPRSGAGGPLLLRLWAAAQRRLGAEIGGGSPGEEMRSAAVRALADRLPLYLIDDSVRETMGHLMRGLAPKERLQLLIGGVIGLVLPSRLVRREVDRYAQAPGEYLSDLREASPQLARVLIDDRNRRMADRITEIVARGHRRPLIVVGDAHRPGIESALRARGLEVVPIPFAELDRLRGP
ncbi:MAG: TraB/GumN family protein [Thermoplasmata archaeon]